MEYYIDCSRHMTNLFCLKIAVERTTAAYFDIPERVLRLSIEIPCSFIKAFGNGDLRCPMIK
jgi:hypothetical protein